MTTQTQPGSNGPDDVAGRHISNPRQPWFIVLAVVALAVAGAAIAALWLGAVNIPTIRKFNFIDVRSIHGSGVEQLWIWLIVGAVLCGLSGLAAIVAGVVRGATRSVGTSGAIMALLATGSLGWVFLRLSDKLGDFERLDPAHSYNAGLGGVLAGLGAILMLVVALVAFALALTRPTVVRMTGMPAGQSTTLMLPDLASQPGIATGGPSPVSDRSLGWLLFGMDGRISRKTYWIVQLCMLGASVVVNVILLVVLIAAGTTATRSETAGLGIFFAGWVVVPLLFAIVTLVISIFVVGKRYHDRNKSAWWQLIGLVPIVGWIWTFVEAGFLRGTIGPNRFGPDPVAPAFGGVGVPPPPAVRWHEPTSSPTWALGAPELAPSVRSVASLSAKAADALPGAGVNAPVVTCRTCARTLAVDDRFCRGCGEPRPPAQPLCRQCGQPGTLGTRFCTSCGTPLTNDQR